MKFILGMKSFFLVILSMVVLQGSLYSGERDVIFDRSEPQKERVQYRLMELKNITRTIVNDIKSEKRLVENEIEILSKLDKANRPVARNLIKDVKAFQDLINEISGFYIESARLLEQIEESYDVTLIRAKQLELEKVQRKVKARIKKAGIETVPGDRFKNIIVVGIDEETYQKYIEYDEIIQIREKISDYINKHVDMEVAILGFRPIELEERFDKGEIDLLVTYNKSIQSRRKLKGVLTAEKNGRISQRCMVVAERGSNIRRISDLRGKTIAVLDRHIRRDLGKYFKIDFSEVASIRIASSNRAALMGLSMGEYDAIIGYENLITSCKKKLRIVAQSEPIQNSPLYVKQTDNKAKNKEIEKLLTCLKKAHKKRELRTLLQKFHVTRLVTYDDKKQLQTEQEALNRKRTIRQGFE